MNIDHVIQVNLLHTIVEHREVGVREPLVAAACHRNHTIPRDQTFAVLWEMLGEGGLLVWRECMWNIVICGEGNDVICPVCRCAMKGKVIETWTDVPLTPDFHDDNNIFCLTSDGDVGSELVEVGCDNCGLAVPYEMVNFRRVG